MINDNDDDDDDDDGDGGEFIESYIKFKLMPILLDVSHLLNCSQDNIFDNIMAIIAKICIYIMLIVSCCFPFVNPNTVVDKLKLN